MDTSGIPLDAYPLELRDGGNGKYYYYRRLGWGVTQSQMIRQKVSAQQYQLAMQNSGGFRRLDNLGNATEENQELQRKQQSGGGTTVVDASQTINPTTAYGGGGGTVPIPTTDNSSARMAAAANDF